MQTTFEINPDEWKEGFWKRIMPLFGKKKVRVTVEEIEDATLTSQPESQFDVYLKMKTLERDYPPFKVDASIDLSKLADESNDVVV